MLLIMNEPSTLSGIYERHHAANRGAGYAILGKERGALIAHLIGQGKNVLDIGCRDGALTEWFVQGNEVTGVDIDAAALQRTSERLGIKTILGDVNGDWSEFGQGYDVVVMGEILEHLYFPEEVLDRVLRVLNEGGMLIGTVPNAFSLKNRVRYALGRKKHTPLSDPTHINHFLYGELDEMLAKRFARHEIRGLGRYTKLAAKLPQWFAFDLLFIGRKSGGCIR
jgi:2-polyprenyl-3-methyl-5-hydroxy-6-metoxy-1,4-benzoquinol methylase